MIGWWLNVSWDRNRSPRCRRQLPAHVDVLDPGVAEELVEAFFLAEAALLPAAVGSAQVPAGRVDPDISGLDPFRQ